MKARFTLFIFLFLCFAGLNAQTGFLGGTVVPLKPQSPLFGKDIVINDSSNQNQNQVLVRSAFNGWLYAEYSSIDPFYNTPTSTVLKSIDNGITWTVLTNLVWPGPYASFKSTDMLVIGDSISKLKLILAWVASVSSNPSAGRGDAYVWRYNAITGEFEDGLMLDSGVSGISLGTDLIYPANNSNPYSLGVVYSKYSSSSDSIIFRSSSNGGESFDSRHSLASSAGRIFKVAISYGRSLTLNSGRYFVAWEEKVDIGSTLGHVYTAHTDPNFNSPLTAPVNLDGLDITDLNSCKNPKIACQNSNVDNDSLNLTEVVLFDKYNSSNQNYELSGYYNLQATNHSNFKKLIISNPTHYSCQSSIEFNPFDSSFMVTYYDSTTQKLPFLQNNFNLRNPDSWQFETTGYNDGINLSSPNPIVALSLAQKQGINVWSSGGPGENGIALFDSPYSTYTGVSGHSTETSARLIGSYPNPCTTTIKIAFELKNAGKVTIAMMSIIGEPLGTITDQSYSAGKHTVQYDVMGLPSGNYLYNVRSGEFSATGKITVIR